MSPPGIPAGICILGDGDDTTVTLAGFTREIQIRNLTVDLRSITVTVTYGAGGTLRTYTLTAYISNYA